MTAEPTSLKEARTIMTKEMIDKRLSARRTVKPRWCKTEVNRHDYAWTKDKNLEVDLLEYFKTGLRDVVDYSIYPSHLSGQMRALSAYFYSTEKVSLLIRLLCGYDCEKRLKPFITKDLYSRNVTPVEVANRVLHTAMYGYLEDMPEDVFASIIAFYVNSRKDPKWSQKCLDSCNAQYPLDFKLWFTQEMWFYIDTYFYSQWWYCYDF